MRDLGLSYEAAMHGVQSAIKFELEQSGWAVNHPALATVIKHLRTGIDARAADAQGLASLLIAKGVFTLEEYTEVLRLAANEELSRYQQHCRDTYGLPSHVEFR